MKKQFDKTYRTFIIKNRNREELFELFNDSQVNPIDKIIFYGK